MSEEKYIPHDLPSAWKEIEALKKRIDELGLLDKVFTPKTPEDHMRLDFEKSLLEATEPLWKEIEALKELARVIETEERTNFQRTTLAFDRVKTLEEQRERDYKLIHKLTEDVQTLTTKVEIHEGKTFSGWMDDVLDNKRVKECLERLDQELKAWKDWSQRFSNQNIIEHQNFQDRIEKLEKDQTNIQIQWNDFDAIITPCELSLLVEEVRGKRCSLDQEIQTASERVEGESAAELVGKHFEQNTNASHDEIEPIPMDHGGEKFNLVDMDEDDPLPPEEDAHEVLNLNASQPAPGNKKG